MNKRVSSFVMTAVVCSAAATFVGVGTSHAAPPIASGSVSLSGRLAIIAGDPPHSSGSAGELRFLLLDERGRQTELGLSEEFFLTADELAAFDRLDVTVTGGYTDPQGTRFRVDMISMNGPHGEGGDAAAQRDVTGSQSWLTILCYFADFPWPPHPPSWYETMMGNAYPGMDHYWREASYDKMDLSGSMVVGWYGLPSARAWYVDDTDGDGTPDKLHRDRITTDCVAAAIDDGHSSDFSDADGINLVFGSNFGDEASQGFGYYPVNVSGFRLFKGVTWIEDGADQVTMAQEMGHAMVVPFLPHSSCSYKKTYDSNWDVMSGGGCCRACCSDTSSCCSNPNCTNNPPGHDYGCVPVHPITYVKDKLGWIDSDRRYKPSGNVAKTITIEQLANPPSANYLMARLKRTTTSYYTVEVRRRSGYDDELPNEGVVIHKVVTTRGDRRARVVEIYNDGDKDCNDASATMVPGDWMHDENKGILVYIKGETSTGYRVSITTSPNDPTYVDVDHGGSEKGTKKKPWDTLFEGEAGVIPEGTIYITPGDYAESFVLKKPLLLKLNGNSGNALIMSN